MATFSRGYWARKTNNTKLIRELGGKQTNPTKAVYTYDPADTYTLRGIPALGRGVAGAIRHTRPGDNLDL